MPTDRPRAAIVLTGGRSERFGDADKVFATLDGQPLVAHVLDRLTGVVDGVVVSCRPDQGPRLRAVLDGDVALCPDPVPGRGPVAGVASAVRAIDAPYTAVVAADNPLVDPVVVDTLFELAAGRPGAVPRVDGRLQSTQAVYDTAALRTAARTALDADGAFQTVVETLDPHIVDAAALDGAPATFRDVDTSSDLATLTDDGSGEP